MHNTTEVQEQSARIEELIGKLEAAADPHTMAIARELVQSVMELYSAGLERVAEVIARKGEYGREILEELGHDELVGNLMAANGLHPEDLDTRVRRGLEKIRAALRSRGTVELESLQDGIVRLRVRSAQPASLKQVVEEAMYEAAPDLVQVLIEEIADHGAAAGFVPLEKLIGSIPAQVRGAGL